MSRFSTQRRNLGAIQRTRREAEQELKSIEEREARLRQLAAQSAAAVEAGVITPGEYVPGELKRMGELERLKNAKFVRLAEVLE